jgi:hypothetical protein
VPAGWDLIFRMSTLFTLAVLFPSLLPVVTPIAKETTAGHASCVRNFTVSQQRRMRRNIHGERV